MQAFFGRVGYDALFDGFENVVDGFVDLRQFLFQQFDGVLSKQFRVVLLVYFVHDQSKVCASQGVLKGLKDDVVQQVFLYELCRAIFLAYGVPAFVVFGHAPGLGCTAIRSHPCAALSAIYALAQKVRVVGNMVAVAVGVNSLLATLEEFRLYDARVDVVVNFSVQFISARVLLGVQYHIDVGGAERLASVEDTTLGKTDGDFVSALTGSVSFKDLLDDGTFFFVDIHLFVFGVVAVFSNGKYRNEGELLKEVISAENVKLMGEMIALQALRTVKKFDMKIADRLYIGLIKDLHHMSEIDYIVSDGYDVAQTAICFLYQFVGHTANEIYGKDRKGKEISIKLACYREVDHFILLSVIYNFI